MDNIEIKREEYQKKIIRYFAYMQMYTKVSVSFGDLNITSIAEDYYIPIIKILFNCPDLENKNVIKYNFPAIDLGCSSTKVSFQVTATPGTDKMLKTIETFINHKLYAVVFRVDMMYKSVLLNV